ncbi:hypothetical protein [Photobacterium profundum]|nr:hypothetical protein [Photobacterium profundum]
MSTRSECMSLGDEPLHHIILYNQIELFMKRISSIALCGMFSTCAIAAPHATWQIVDCQERIVISQLPTIVTPPLATHSSIEQGDPFVIESESPNAPLSLVEAAIAGSKKTPAKIAVKPQQAKQSTAYQTPTKKVIQPQYVVTKGQSYMTALRQWVAKDKLTRVAWSLPPETIKTLNETSPNGEVFKGSLSQVVSTLGKQLDTPLHFAHNPMKGLSAIHTLGSNVELNWVHGATLKAAVHNLTTDFDWSWKEGMTIQGGSWMSPDNFQLAAPYPIVSPRGDFAFALNTVLDGYPVQAQLLYGTQLIFIMEKE